ncbi:MAG: formyltetrahydrofolate deformylase [Candidatus Omnitrophota bacterium]|nr:formyltetrahydrofolate deformylase [Candidatus Omnitrophota bacterium]
MEKIDRIYVLLFQCVDRMGIVAEIAGVIRDLGCNIITADQYSTDPEGGHFFMRVEFLPEAEITEADLAARFAPIAKKFDAAWLIRRKQDIPRMGILVSGPGHCLQEILYLWSIKELRCDIPFVISNDDRHFKLVSQYNIPFHYIRADKNNRKEEELMALVLNKTDFLVLARYMLVLSENFLREYGKDIINIHHGFLPSFKGADPYQKALEQGVKVIGATAHFVNDRLDDGPIITQEVEAISHKDDLAALISKGRHLEKKALALGIAAYLDHRIIRCGNKTIVF